MFLRTIVFASLALSLALVGCGDGDDPCRIWEGDGVLSCSASNPYACDRSTNCFRTLEACLESGQCEPED